MILSERDQFVAFHTIKKLRDFLYAEAKRQRVSVSKLIHLTLLRAFAGDLERT